MTRPVFRIIARRLSQFVERLFRTRQIIDPHIEQHFGSCGIASDEQTTDAILLVGLGEHAADSQPRVRNGFSSMNAANGVASLFQYFYQVDRHGTEKCGRSVAGSIVGVGVERF